MEKHTHEYFSEMLKRTGAVTMVNGEWVPMTPENCPKIRIYNPKQTMTRLHRMLATFHPVGSWAQIRFPTPNPQADSKSQLKSPSITALEKRFEQGVSRYKGASDSISCAKSMTNRIQHKIKQDESRRYPSYKKIGCMEINEEEIQTDVFRLGTNVNENGCAVRLTHLPTGVVVSCGTKRSLHANRQMAMRMLKSKLYDINHQETEAT